jgi:hypothetical protein
LTSDAWHLSVRCHRCHARTGDPCVGARGDMRESIHRVRWDLLLEKKRRSSAPAEAPQKEELR